MVERQTSSAPETPKEGLLSGFRSRLSRLFGKNAPEAEAMISSREEYRATPDPSDMLRSEVEINDVKMNFGWNETYHRFQITFPDLSPNSEQSNYIVATDNAKLAIPIVQHAKGLAEQGKGAQEVMDETGRFMISHLREKLTEDDGRRPNRDWEGNELN